MRSVDRKSGAAPEIVAALTLVIDTLAALDLKDNPLAQVRRADEALDRVLAMTAPEGQEVSPPGFRQRVVAAKHCLRLGKPRECLKMIEQLRAELQGP